MINKKTSHSVGNDFPFVFFIGIDTTLKNIVILGFRKWLLLEGGCGNSILLLIFAWIEMWSRAKLWQILPNKVNLKKPYLETGASDVDKIF